MARRTKITSFEVYMENVEEAYYVGRNGVEEIVLREHPVYDERYCDIKFDNGEVKSFLSTVPHAITEEIIKEEKEYGQ